jgi:hypothetical protein
MHGETVEFNSEISENDVIDVTDILDVAYHLRPEIP